MKATPFLVLPLLPLLLLSSCSLEKHLAKLTGNLNEQYADILTWEQLPIRTITWNQAMDMIQANNLEVQDIELQIRRAERDRISVYTDMIPGVSYYGYFTQSIKELGNTASLSNFNNNVNIDFNVPTLTQVPYRVYASHATAFAALKAKEGKQRELASKLYVAARRRDIDKKLVALEAQVPDAPEEKATAAYEKHEADIEYWKAVADVLGDRSARWEILPDSIPVVRWEEYRNKIAALDPLIVCKYALKLEQSRMSMYGIALQYLPTINTSLYSPSLFSSSGGTYSGTFLSGEDTRLNLNVSYSLDTKLTQWNSYQDAKEKYERTKKEVANDMMDHKANLAKLRQSVDEYNHWRSYMHKRMDFIRRQSALSGSEYLQTAKTLQEMERELLRQERTAVESEAALVLEYGMPGSR